MSRVILSLVLGLTLSLTASAKEMTSRLGVGYVDSFSVAPMPSLGIKYYASRDLAVSLALGIDTKNSTTSSGQSNFGFGARVYKTIFPEDNMNFYMGAGGGLISSAPSSGTTGTTTSGFELLGFCGAEIFLPGIDSLGFNFTAGVGIASTGGGVRFRTIGESPLTAGMFFYF